jgi:hypothetical protein
MDRIEVLREQLIEKKSRIKRSMTFHRKFASPLSNLPVELLSRIFVNCLPAAYESSVSRELAPLLLTRICRRWRGVAVNMPSLWCMLSVCYRHWEEESFRYRLWLKRSQGLPLSIRCFANAKTELQSLLQPYNYYTQVTSLHILSTDADIEPKFLIRGLPGLRELTIDWHGNDDDDEDGDGDRTAITELIQLLPCTLHTLKLKEIVVDPVTHFSTSNKVWAHLKNIYITVKRPHHMLDLLPVCPNLTSLKVNVPATGGYWSEVVHPSEPLEPVTHTNLQSLFISSPSWTTSDLLPAVFDALTLPNLRVLEAYHVWFPDKELRTFVARSNCPLKLFGGSAGMSSLR